MHTMEYYSNLKREEILAHATTWVNCEDMLSETSQVRKDRYCMLPLYGVPRAVRLPRAGGEGGGRRREPVFGGWSFSSASCKGLETAGGDSCTAV